MSEKTHVHFMGFGMTACLVNGPPTSWPANHRWSSNWADVTCGACLAGRELIHTFTISEDGKSITCLRCKRTSHNPHDVQKHYCGRCGIFHDDLWPPARKAWVERAKTEHFMELNPNHKVVKQAHDNWHKIAALIMLKLGKTELQLTMDDVRKIERGNVNIVLDARDESETAILTVRIVDDKTADELARKEGGRACDS